MVKNTNSDPPESSKEEVVSVQNLTKTYGAGEEAVRAVDGISFEINAGTVVGLLGPNGAGKTTTIKSLLGTIVPDDGSVEVFGKDVHADPQQAYKHVGVMFEGSRDAYWRLTVRENLEFFTRLNGIRASNRRSRHDTLLERFELKEKADVPVRKLSRGMKQKVSLASTLSRDVDLVFLDEPTLGLDIETSLTLREELRTLVKEQNMTVLLSSHDMDVVEDLCDRVIIMSQGEILADDSVSNLLKVLQNDAYRVRLDEPVVKDVKEKLNQEFDVTDSDQYAGVCELTVGLSEGDIHDLSNVLRDLDCSVRSLEAVTPDLEDVFLEITGGR